MEYHRALGFGNLNSSILDVPLPVHGHEEDAATAISVNQTPGAPPDAVVRYEQR